MVPRSRVFQALSLCAALALPVSAQTPANFDRRYFLGPAKDQLFRGSCLTFASLAAMEYVPGVPRLSEAYAYSILKADADDFDGSTLLRMKGFLEQNPMLAESVAAEKLPYESIASYGF